MSVFSLSLGKGKTGLTLSAQKVDVDGNDVDSEITSGFIEVGDGFYIWTYNMDSSFQGCIKFINTANNEVLAFTSINPSELSPTGLDNIEIEQNINFKQAIKIMAAVLAGEVSISNNRVTFKAVDNPSVVRVESDTTPLGERTSVDVNL